MASLAALHRAELRERVALGDDELTVLVRDVALDVAGVDEVGQHALDLVVVHVHADGGEAAQEGLEVDLRAGRSLHLGLHLDDGLEKVAVPGWPNAVESGNFGQAPRRGHKAPGRHPSEDGAPLSGPEGYL